MLMPRGALPATSWEGVRLKQKKERGSNALNNARREIKNGNSVAAEASLKEAIKIFKSLLMSVNNTEQPRLFK
jgi:hypothetical protein